jgi:phosphoadenosine phosphosulfate reductase
MVDAKRVEELQAKIAKSKEIFREAFNRFRPEEMRLIWSGGKDSTLVLWICRQFCEEKGLPLPKAFTIDEGDAFDEIHDFLNRYSREWNVALDWGANDDVLRACGRQLGATVRVRDLGERNQAELKRIGFEEDEFPFEAESFVGNHLMKTVVFNTYLEQAGVRAAFQGLRWDEQATRRNDPYFEDVASSALTPGHTRARPILHFSERDLWDATLHFKIPYCSLYEKGYRSLGARTTSRRAGEVAAWEQDLEHTAERGGRRQDKEEAMEKMRKLGYM